MRSCRRVLLGPVVVPALVAVLALSACGSEQSGGAGPRGTAGSGSTVAPGADSGSTGLVVVEDGVGGSLAGSLADAVQQGHGEVSASGAIVGVRTPAGTWIATIGTSRPGGTEPMTVDMHQRVGSVTKTFTTTLLLQLAAAGELSLDDPIGDRVPGTPNPQATLGQLAAMRSGIPSYTLTDEFASAFFADPDRQWRPEELVDLVDGAAPLFEPGMAWDYSNTNLVLLGMVIEQVSGRTLDELIASQIAGPLGLSGTEMPVGSAFAEPHARGETVQGQPDRVPVDATDWNPSWAWAAGGMISTVEDLLTYSRELVVGDTLLGAEMQAERIASMESQGAAFAPDHTYGYGLQQANGWWGHTGELPGFNTFMYHHVAQDLTVVVMVNSDIKAGACTGDAEALSVPGGPTVGPCIDPAVHIADLVTAALGHPGNPGDVGGLDPVAPAGTAPGAAAGPDPSSGG